MKQNSILPLILNIAITILVGCSDEASTRIDDNNIESTKINGVSQKGPFITGSVVTAYELDGSKNLLQTGRTFTGRILSDDGQFELNNVSLQSSYLVLVANGFYRNEVTGENSISAISLNAITDLNNRNTVNVNLLTNLEYDRVVQLMKNGDESQKLNDVKKQAEKEIFNAFYIDASAFGYSEDLDIFGSERANAALLAVSILLQGDHSESELTSLLTKISLDMANDGSWDDLDLRANIAQWAEEKDLAGSFLDYRKKMEEWNIGTIPNFEEFIRNFWTTEYGLGLCGSDSIPFGLVKNASNNHGSASLSYARDYADSSSTIRFICDEPGLWRIALNIEKDTAYWGHNYKDGDSRYGQINKSAVYVYENGNWRSGEDLDIQLGAGGCTTAKKNLVVNTDYGWYKCTYDEYVSGWREALPIEIDTNGLKYGDNNKTHAEGEVFKSSYGDSNIYVYENDVFRFGDSLDFKLGIGCIASRKDSIAQALQDSTWYKCIVDTNVIINDRRTITNVWRRASNIEKDTATWGISYKDGDVRNGNVNNSLTYVFENGFWRNGTSLDSIMKKMGGFACTKSQLGDTSTIKISTSENDVELYYVCSIESGDIPFAWEIAPDIYNDTYDMRSDCTLDNDGKLKAGRVNINQYYVCDYDEHNWRLPTTEYDYTKDIDGCTYLRSKERKKGADSIYYVCYNKKWYSGLEFSWDLPKDVYLNPNVNYNSFTDKRDGQIYKSVTIGNQVWMAENLNYNSKGSACYGDDSTHCFVAGRLYSGSDVSDSLCPNGWHIPSVDEYDTLLKNVGIENLDGNPTILRSSIGWDSTSEDTYGFSSAPFGIRVEGEWAGATDCAYCGLFAHYWTSHAYGINSRSYKNIGGWADVDSFIGNMNPIRCLKDSF